jgi:hypothetical protein
MGGGGKTTNVTNTGLGDDQYQKLADNQVGISGQITNQDNEATKRFDNIDTRFNTVDSSVTGLNDSLSTGFTNMNDLMDKYNTSMNTQFTGVNTGLANNATASADNASALSNIQTDVTGGFDAANTRFNTLDASNTNLQGTVDQGFVDQAQGFTDAQSDRAEQFAAAEAATTQSFADTGAALEQGFGQAATDRAATQANVLGGQNNIQNDLQTMSDTSDIYAAQSLENQANLQTSQDGFVSNFDAYADRYDANATADQRIRADIGSFANNAAVDRQNISNDMDTQFAQLGSTVEGGFSDANTSTNRAIANNSRDNVDALNQLQYDLDTGMENLDSAQVAAARDLAKIASTQTELDMSLRQNFNQLGNAFDDNGQLISNSIDAQGNTIARSVDQQGNLLLRSFDATGSAIGEKVLNVRSTLRDLQAIQNAQGANASMGNLSPAMAGDVPTTGFASPFATTR